MNNREPPAGAAKPLLGQRRPDAPVDDFTAFQRDWRDRLVAFMRSLEDPPRRDPTRPLGRRDK